MGQTAKLRISQLFVLAVLAAGPAVGLASDRVAPVVDAVIRPLMVKDRLPGVAVGITVDGRSRVFDYGEASLQSHKPVTADTLFEIGSVSKTFTATLAAYAALRGRMALCDKAGDYLRYLRGTRLGNVSLLDLATFTSGGLPLQLPANVRTNGELVRYFRTWRPRYAPGTYRTYSNPAIGLLGLATARSMHQGFSKLLRRHLLVPLGLRHTFVDVPAAYMSDYAQGYTSAGTPIRMERGLLAAAAYGIKSTAGDMIRFVQANMRLAGPDDRLQRAIVATHTGYYKQGPLTQDLVWEQYPRPLPLKTLLAGNSMAMLFDAVPARRISPAQSPRADVWINKTGATNGFGAYVAFIPEMRLGIVILANRNFPISDRVTAGYDILTSLVRLQDAASKHRP